MVHRGRWRESPRLTIAVQCLCLPPTLLGEAVQVTGSFLCSHIARRLTPAWLTLDDVVSVCGAFQLP